jgi:hypothetical protein
MAVELKECAKFWAIFSPPHFHLTMADPAAPAAPDAAAAAAAEPAIIPATNLDAPPGAPEEELTGAFQFWGALVFRSDETRALVSAAGGPVRCAPAPPAVADELPHDPDCVAADGGSPASYRLSAD